MVFDRGSGNNADDERGPAHDQQDPESTQFIGNNSEQTQRIDASELTQRLAGFDVSADAPSLTDTPEGQACPAPTQVLPEAAADPALLGLGAAEDGPPPKKLAGKRRRGGLITAIVLGSVLLALGVAYAVDLVATSGKIERGTHVAGIDIGGLTPEQATARLNEQALPEFAKSISIGVHGQAVTANPAEMGLGVDIAGAVAEVGTRSANPIARVNSFFRNSDLPLKTLVDKDKLTSYLTEAAKQSDVAEVEGALERKGTELVITQPVTGKALDVSTTADQVAKAWAEQGPKGLTNYAAHVVEKKGRVTSEALAKADQQAKAILAGPLKIKLFEGEAQVPVEKIAEHLAIAPDSGDGFTVSVDPAAIKAAVLDQINATQAESSDAVISMTNDGPKITPSVTGRKVNWEETDATLATALQSPDRTWTISYATAEPGFSTAQAEGLGIKEVIGEWTTGGFSWASGQNVKVVAAKVNGAIIKPHETFSLNKFTGPRGIAEGYIASGIIKNGKPDTAVGGGISQFATTLYNASYFAGMGDVTHKPHSFYISRYPEGREATVYEGVIDLAFSNDYDTGAMIQTIWTDSNITIRIWGTKTVEVESVRGERFNHTPAKVITVPAGQECRPSNGSGGWSIVDTRIIRDLAGKELRRENFTTVYVGETQVICEKPPETETPGAPPAPGGG